MLRILSVSALVLVLGACSGDDGDDGAGSPQCNDVCACVVAGGGNPTTCQNECAATESAGGNQRLSCQLKLDGWGFPQCKPKCDAFPAS
jgi:hypothetical protein